LRKRCEFPALAFRLRQEEKHCDCVGRVLYFVSVPKNMIVLLFYSPSKRAHTEFAVA
jgi:hypothetical protein